MSLFRFYFTVGENGLVGLVHFTADETYELLMLKKVLASTLATNVQVYLDRQHHLSILTTFPKLNVTYTRTSQ